MSETMKIRVSFAFRSMIHAMLLAFAMAVPKQLIDRSPRT
jgi:hypothetical protein